MVLSHPFLTLFTLAKVLQAASSSNCVGTISSLSDVSNAVKCTTVRINGFTVPAGQTFKLDLLQGTIVDVLGDIRFGNTTWAGPLFQIEGLDITFNGNGHTWDGGGPFYWDGLGGSGTEKPDPMMSIYTSGTFSDVRVLNSPERGFSIDSVGPLIVRGIVIDDSQGAYPNAKSNGLPAGNGLTGRNTDGFDVAGNDIVIQDCTVINQDDCLAINRGQNIVFENNYCEGGHGISIGSISSYAVVEGVVIQSNTVVNSTIGFRIKTKKFATNAKVHNITYLENIAANCADYGVLITQSYPDPLGTPGNGVVISDINFSGTTRVSVAGDANVVAVNCGMDSCTGSWDWSGLETSGGKVGLMKNCPNVIGHSQHVRL